MKTEYLKKQISVLQKMGLDVSHLQQQLDELESSANNSIEELREQAPEGIPSEIEEISEPKPNETTSPIKAALAIQDTDAQENELDEDIDEPSAIQKIAVAPTIEIHKSAWTLSCCYFWLTSKNMSERKGVVFNTPKPFLEMVTRNLCSEVPEQAEWTVWNRIHGHALEHFLTSKENIEEYKQALEEIMCNKSHWWREKYLVNSELPTI